MKIIFTKNQAVSALNCIFKRQEIDLFLPIDPKDKKLLLSCEELEVELRKYISSEQISTVVENPIEPKPIKKTKR